MQWITPSESGTFGPTRHKRDARRWSPVTSTTSRRIFYTAVGLLTGKWWLRDRRIDSFTCGTLPLERSCTSCRDIWDPSTMSISTKLSPSVSYFCHSCQQKGIYQKIAGHEKLLKIFSGDPWKNASRLWITATTQGFKYCAVFILEATIVKALKMS